MIVVNLFNQPEIETNVKSRTPRTTGQEYDVVRNGNTIQTNIWDLTISIELSCPHEEAGKFHRMSVNHGTLVMIYDITSVVYINDNHTLVNASLDVPSTLFHNSNTMTSAFGNLGRATLSYDVERSLVNMLPEPVSVGDWKRGANRAVSVSINEAISSFSGLSFGPEDPLPNMAWIVIVSNKIKQFLNLDTGSEFTNPNTTEGEEIIDVEGFRGGFGGVPHSGGMYTGFPLRFDELEDMDEFLRNITSGKMLRYYEEFDPANDLHTHQNSVVEGAVDGLTKDMINWAEHDRQVITTITPGDIIGIQLIPRRFATSDPSPIMREHEFITDPTHGLDDVTSMGRHSNDMSKILMYPYTYHRIETTYGDSIDLIPQLHQDREETWHNTLKYDMRVTYLGGDNPKLMLNVHHESGNHSRFDFGATNEWLTLCEFPTINATIGGGSAQLRQWSRETNAKISRASAKSAMGFSYGQQERNRTAVRNTAQIGVNLSTNLANAAVNASSAGTLIGKPATLLTGAAYAGVQAAGQTTMALVDHVLQNDRLNDQLAMEMGGIAVKGGGQHFLSNTDSIVTSANEGLISFLYPPVKFYTCGGSNSEVHSVAHYFDQLGQALNQNYDVVTRTGQLWGGRASITTNSRGLAYYKYNNVYIQGTAPSYIRDIMANYLMTGLYIIGG